MKYKLHTSNKKLLADTHTPVGIYLKLRDKFQNCLLLESSDYHGNENSYSFICCQPIAIFKVSDEVISVQFPDTKSSSINITKGISVADELKKFSESFEVDKTDSKFAVNGLFGYTTYDSVRYFEDIKLKLNRKHEKEIPDMMYSVYRFVIAINHFKEELYLFENKLENEI